MQPRFSDEQLSMILSALAGDQPLCCDQHAPHRESIARTPEQLAALTSWADRHTGCRLGKGLPQAEQWKISARERYLDNVAHLEDRA
jgi:hypothetical protein